MKKRDEILATRFDEALHRHDDLVRRLPGIHDEGKRRVLVRQLVESEHRVRYVSVIAERDVSPRRADPSDAMFDPIKAAILHHRDGRIDEAFWCVFLFVHFGRHAKGGYRYLRDVYGRLGDGDPWGWLEVSTDPEAFRTWLEENVDRIRGSSQPGGFGNHRKYESLDNIPAVVESYVDWVLAHEDHEGLMDAALKEAEGDERMAFDILYRSMDAVRRFGRMGRFDYLTMVGKLGLARITAGSAYLDGATGPYEGAKLLFGEHATSKVSRAEVDAWLVELGASLDVGMQVIEDALCNWQKSPGKFVAFRG